MNRFSDWWNRSSAALAELVERPWLCACLLLAIRSIFRPYLGLVHDAKLYSLQVASHVWPNVYDTDLFFAFGSQDSFSVFSRLMAPLAGAIGIEPSFFVVWMICTAAIIYAEVQLVRRLVEHRALAAVALVLLTLTDVAYGGMQVFHVHEPFLTARLPGVALVLFAFVQLLDQRYVRAGALLIVAMVMHPLMSVPGLFVGGAFIASARWKMERLAVIGGVSAVVLAAVVAIPAVGESLFGRMDGEWLRITKDICAQCFPSLWSANEWCRTCIALAIVVGVRGYLPPLVGRLAFWVAFTAIAGLFVNAYAEWVQYAFLIQGQAFRALWLAEFLAYPLGLLLVWRLWEAEAAKKVMAVPVAAYVMQPFVHGSMQGEIALETIALWIVSSTCVGIFVHAWSRRRNEQTSLGLAVLFGMIGMSVFISVARFLSFIVFADHSTERISLLWWFATHAVSVAVVAVASLAAVVMLVRRCGTGRRLAAGALAVWLVIGALPFGIDSLRLGEKRFAEGDRDMAFVQSFLAIHRSPSPPQIYWPADPSRIWLNLHGTSYFSWYQMWGIIFSEDLSQVAADRAQLARRFEVDWMREAGLPESMWDIPLAMLKTDFDELPPDEEDLLRLAEEPTLDWIVTKHDFGDLAVATNGTVYIYDARQLRQPRGVVVRSE
jgi:hypothetical protein